MTENRPCEACGGDGGWEAMPHSPHYPPRWSTCEACDGNGETEWTTDDDEPVGPDEGQNRAQSAGTQI